MPFWKSFKAFHFQSNTIFISYWEDNDNFQYGPLQTLYSPQSVMRLWPLSGAWCRHTTESGASGGLEHNNLDWELWCGLVKYWNPIIEKGELWMKTIQIDILGHLSTIMQYRELKGLYSFMGFHPSNIFLPRWKTETKIEIYIVTATVMTNSRTKLDKS